MTAREWGEEMQEAWELFRRGQLDQERHHKLVREAIRKNLAELVSHGQILAGGRVVIPVQELKQWRFEFDTEEQEHTGAFPPDSSGSGQGRPQGRPRVGDVVGRRQTQGRGKGSGNGQPGDAEGHAEGVYEVEISAEAVAQALFADLELPRMHRKAPADAFTEYLTVDEIRKKGPFANLDKRRTVVQNIRRNAASGDPSFGRLTADDLRFRTPEVRRVPQDQVAVLFLRDRSGSMGEEEKRLTRALATWITSFLQFKYRKVAQTAFILFDTEAQEVDEDLFIHQSEGGGTKVSTGFRLAREIVQERFPSDRFNLYLFAFSDGDNSTGDNPEVCRIVEEFVPTFSLIGYTDIHPGSGRGLSDLALDLRRLNAPNLATFTVRAQEDVLAAMQHFFGKREGGAA